MEDKNNTHNNRQVLEKVAREIMGAKTPQEVEKAVKELIRSFS